MHLLAAFDKFRGTLSASDACHAAVEAAIESGWSAESRPLADGGEGTLEALGGANQTTTVTGPLGSPVEARWRLTGGVAVVEMAEASGMKVVGDRSHNDPVAATTFGTGELIKAAIDGGATRVIVGVGGSATTDGGSGAVEAIGVVPAQVSIEVACDVTTLFLDAARVYGPQKGATARQVDTLTQRLSETADTYRRVHGCDIRSIPGSGAAGGLAGGLAAIGAQLRSGFDVIADHVGLEALIAKADLVVTGEGKADATSWQGKVVGGVAGLADGLGVPILIVVGMATDIPTGVDLVSLTEEFGYEAALNRPALGIQTTVRQWLSRGLANRVGDTRQQPVDERP